MAGLLQLEPKIEAAPRVTPVIAQIECHAKTAPKINVIPSKSHVKYDFTRTKAQLNTADIDTVSPYGPQHKTNVSGLMSGSIEVKNQIGFMHETYEQLGVGCLYLNSVEVRVHVDPTVYIAREHPQGSCMHTAVLEHERKHVREDQLIVNKYANIIGKALASVVNSQGAAFGPYEKERMPVVQQNIQNSLNKVVKKYNDELNQERRQRQQAIDNFEEYESIGKRCKNQ